MSRTRQVHDSWSHRPWWQDICRLFIERLELCDVPIEVMWTSSHLLEHMPTELISEAAARQYGSTVRDITANRAADREAHRLATVFSPIHPRDQKMLEAAVLHRHEWFVMLNWLLETTQPPPTTARGPKATAEPTASVVSRFPQWAWAAPCGAFPWKPKSFDTQGPPARWTGTDEDWRECRRFLQSLHVFFGGEAIVTHNSKRVLASTTI